jgi:hypothetical protein
MSKPETALMFPYRLASGETVLRRALTPGSPLTGGQVADFNQPVRSDLES